MAANRQAALDEFRARYIAHRGLFDNEQDHPENTLPAFARAVEAGYGIELDVRLTKDGKLVVAHDTGLARLCDEDIAIRDLTLDELRAYHVLKSAQTIPLFSEVLDLIDGRVPLIVELKPEQDVAETCRLTDETLRSYAGTYCIECFDPRVLLWYRRHRPGVIRGQLAEDFAAGTATKSRLVNWALTAMAFNVATWPDFIAYNRAQANRFALRFWHAVLRCTLVAWTIKAQDELDAARRRFTVFIFDSFIPAGSPRS